MGGGKGNGKVGGGRSTDLHVAVGVEQEVLRLEVSVDDVHVVEVLEGEHDDAAVEGRRDLGKAPVQALRQRG